MHPEVHNYVQQAVAGRTFGRVVEVGSVDINGSIRSLITAEHYIGIDIIEGPSVDVVADASVWTPPHAAVDLAVCCEVFEHAQCWPQIVANVASWLVPDGLLVTTCATEPRPPHAANGDSEGPKPGEYYRNVKPADLQIMALSSGLTVIDFTVNHGDLYMTATRA